MYYSGDSSASRATKSMSISFERWPFLRHYERTPEQQALWWEKCYYPSAIANVVQSFSHWQLVVGESGSGKSVLLADLARTEKEHALVLEYPPTLWPGARQARHANDNHLAQMMTLISSVLRHRFTEQPTMLTPLSTLHLEYIRWLIEKFEGPRRYQVWKESLPSETRTVIEKIEFQDWYPTQTDARDVQGQIEDLIALVRALGLERILILIDLTMPLPVLEQQQLGELMGWLELMHHPGFALVAAIPTRVFEETNLTARTRGRANVTSPLWSGEETRKVGDRYLNAATSGMLEKMEELIKPRALAALSRRMKTIAPRENPRAWIEIVHIGLEIGQTHKLPLNPDALEILWNEYVLRCFPLRLDPNPARRGLWRGEKFIALDDQPFRFAQMLWNAHGSPVSVEELKQVAGSYGNIHTLARRIRQALEPDGHIYLINKRGEGYILAQKM